MTLQEDYIDTWRRVFTTSNQVLGVEVLHIHSCGKGISCYFYFTSFTEFDAEEPEVGQWTYSQDSGDLSLKIISGDLNINYTLSMDADNGDLISRSETSLTSFERSSKEPADELSQKLYKSINGLDLEKLLS